MDELFQRRGRDRHRDRALVQHLRQGHDEEHRVHLQELAQDLARHEPDPRRSHPLNDASCLQCHG